MQDSKRPRGHCIDPDHGIGDHPCDDVLGAERAATLRDTGYDEPKYICSGEGQGFVVDCGFSTNSLNEANRHFERTGHNVDSAEGQVERDTLKYCEHTAGGDLDSSLRFVDCDQPAMFGLYDKQTLDVIGHVCAQHVQGTYGQYGTVIENGYSVKDAQRALGAD